MIRFLEKAIEAQARPRKTANDSVVLRHGSNYKMLVNTSGSVTKAGKEYQRLKPDTELEIFTYDPQQTPARTGNRETIKLRGGKERVVRVFDPTTDNFKYTSLGKRFFASKRTEYIVKVPAKFSGKRANGKSYSRQGLYPIHAPVNVPASYNQQQRDAFVKSHVTNSFESGIIAEYSEETIKYNEQGQWSIVEMTTTPDNMNAPDVIDRALGAYPGSVSMLLFPESIVEEAFQNLDDRMCCIRQIAAVTKLYSPDEVISYMDDIEESLYGTSDWRDKGVTGKMIFEFAKRTDRGCCLVHNNTAIEMHPGKNALVFAVLESHAYFYSDMAVRRKLMKRIDPVKIKLKRDTFSSTTPDASQWLPFEWPPSPGHFWVDHDQIDVVRNQFLSLNLHPKVLLKDESTTKSLHYVFTKAEKQKGTCVIHAMPHDARDMMQWLRTLDIGIAYRGEGLPNLTYKVLNKLLKIKQRMQLEPEEKHELLETHDYACATCGDRGKVEWDHKIRLSQSYGDPKPDQPLCQQCHANKTAEEPREFERSVLESNVDEHVWTHYVKSERLPPLILKNELCETPAVCMIADVVRCRMRALLLNVHPIPVLCPCDNIQILDDYTLGDLNFVTRKASNFIKLNGYTGPGWQSRILTEWLLYTGIITWSDITHKLTATGRLPPDLLRKPLEKMEEAWGDAGFQKESINSMIGTWMLDDSHSYSLISSHNPMDAPKNALKRIVHFEGGNVVDYITKTQMRSVTTMRPLHDLCMSTEAVRVGQMLYCLQKQRAVIHEIKTDSVLYKLKKKSQDVLASLTFKDLKLRQRFESNNCLNQFHDLIVPDCDWPVYRVHVEATEKDLLKMDPQMPKRSQTMCLPQMQWRELDEAEAERRVLAGENLFVCGIAGTGKSHLCLSLVEKLRSLKRKIDIIAKTHTASARATGVTADHYVRRSVLHGCCHADCVWVEECFQIETSLWAQLNKLNVQWILSGDEAQFPPVFDSWRSCAVEEGQLSASRMFHRMAGGNRLMLRTCRRSDSFLFNFYSSLIKGGCRFQLPLNAVLAEARGLFNYEGICRNNLCISHAKRIRINTEINLVLKPDNALYVKAAPVKGQANAAQSMFIWEGIQLLGCASYKKIRNNVLYTVTKIDDDSITVDQETKLTFPQVQHFMRLSFARTYASCQGTEFSDELRLHCTNNRHFTLRHLFVGSSRCKDRRLVAIT